MRARSKAFDDAVLNGGTKVSYLEFWNLRSGRFLASATSTDTTKPPLALKAGKVTVDITATSRRRLTATLLDPEGYWAPLDAQDVLSVVSGNVVGVWTGFRFANGNEEVLPEGWFVIGEPSVEDRPDGLSIQLAGEDYSRIVRDNGWEKPYTVKKGQFIVAAAKALLTNRFPEIQFRGLGDKGSPYTTPFLVFDEQEDPFDATNSKILASGGLEAFFDAEGFCVIQEVPDVAPNIPVWTYGEGALAQTKRLRGATRREDIFNGVLAVGENTSGISPARAVVWDTDPSSPTYAGTDRNPGPFGRKLKRLSPNPAIVFNAQAAAAATAELRRTSRYAPAFDIDLRVHPAHDGGDTVILQRHKLGLVDDQFLMERFEIGLSVGDGGSARVRRRAV